MKIKISFIGFNLEETNEVETIELELMDYMEKWNFTESESSGFTGLLSDEESYILFEKQKAI
jgi:hypothetical protein